MNKKQHEKWLKKHGADRVRIKTLKNSLGSPCKLPSYKEELEQARKINRVDSLSGMVPENGTKHPTEEIERIKVSSSYPTMPAYNKGPVMVVSKSELPYAGKKI